MKKICNNFIIFILTFFCSLLLFAEEESSSDEWEIEDYKRAIMSKDIEIQEFEEFFAFDTGEKFFLCKYNPTVMRSEIHFFIYAFNQHHEHDEYALGFAMDNNIIKTITHSIPGINLWDAPVFIGDFNNDGQKEIASMIFAGTAPTFQILGIDPDIKDVVYFFEWEFYVDWPPTFPPVEFMKYRGMDGFKMLRIVPPLERASIKYPFQGNKSISWFFYTWDEEERKYVIVEEVNPDYLNENNQIDSEPEVVEAVDIVETEYKEEENAFEKASVFIPADSGKKSGFNLYIAITAGIAVLAAATVFIVLRMKKKIP
jgi:hypothetical protein